MNTEQQQLVDLVTKHNLTLMSYPYSILSDEVKRTIVEWLDEKGFPTDDVEEVLGDEYVLAWFADNSQLLIFSLSYDGPEQCGGSVIFSYDGRNCEYVGDTVECSS